MTGKQARGKQKDKQGNNYKLTVVADFYLPPKMLLTQLGLEAIYPSMEKII